MKNAAERLFRRVFCRRAAARSQAAKRTRDLRTQTRTAFVISADPAAACSAADSAVCFPAAADSCSAAAL